MKKSKNLMIIAILFMAIGFAAVSTTLILNGTIKIGTNQDDFDVYFSNAVIDGTQNLSVISSDKKTINFETKALAKVGDKSILEYEITNASTQYDANVSVTCTPNETELYKVVNTIDKEIIEARNIGNGVVTVELKKNVLEEQKINFTCTITANAVERESTGTGFLPSEDTYVLEGTYVDSTGKVIPNANLVVYSDTPHYVTTDANGNLLVSGLEKGSHEIYHVNDTIENIKTMTKNEIINKAITSSNFTTSSSNIVFGNKSSISAILTINSEYCSKFIGKEWNFNYTGNEQEFFTICDGEYKIELWGASGGTINSYLGGNGAYTTGNIKLHPNDLMYIYVGGAGSRSDVGGYNGGSSLIAGQSIFGASGGGATDVRLVNGIWNNFESLKSRIMVAGGGGGANNRAEGYGDGPGGAGGTLEGVAGISVNHTNGYGYAIGTGGTQTSGGIYTHNSGILNSTFDGVFGSGGGISQSGGGGGWYGGASSGHGGAGGGSSFISGHTGCDAISEESTASNLIHTGKSGHYSGVLFTNTKMIAGNETMPTHDGTTTMVGNLGHGYAKITYLGV